MSRSYQPVAAVSLAVVLVGLAATCRTVETTAPAADLIPDAISQSTAGRPGSATPRPGGSAEAHQDSDSVTATGVGRSGSPDSDAVNEIASQLKGLPFDEFVDQSYGELLKRYPQYLTTLGISADFGLRDDRMNDFSDGYTRETQALETAVLDLLGKYDRTTLTPAQNLTAEVYEWYLDDQVRGHSFTYHDYPLHQIVGSYHDHLIRFFTEYHRITNRQQAEDYVTRLSVLDTQIEQLLDGLERRTASGIVPPAFVLRMVQGQLREYLQIDDLDADSVDVRRLSVYTTLRERLSDVTDMSDAEKGDLLAEALKATGDGFVPGYIALISYVAELEAEATDEAGVWKLPSGEAYYAYQLRHQTTTDLTADEIHELGLAEVERIQEEVRQVFAGLGYPEDGDPVALMGRAIREGGSYDLSAEDGRNALLRDTETLIREAETTMEAAFDVAPRREVEVVGGPMGGFYVPASVDGSRPGAYHVGLSGNWSAKYRMASVAYHEAVPGHHFQIALAQELDLPGMRRDMGFTGFSEGWALYAERLAWEMGLYEDDPYGNLGRLQFELLRAARLVTDTGIHSKQWTRDQANAYLNDALFAQPGTFDHEVDRYIVRPAQATSYKIGMLKMLELRQRAQDALGEDFDLKAFHNVVLGNGSLPLEVLEDVVDAWIAEAQGA